MKRTIAILLVLSSVLFIFGCAQNADEPKMNEFQYDVQVCGYSDSVSEADYSLEFPLWYSESYEKNNLKGKSFEWEKSNIPLKGEYNYSNIRTYEYYPTHRYIGEDGHNFEVDENGNLVFFYRGLERVDLTENSLSQERCVEIASDFFAQMVDGFEDYTVTFEYSDYYQNYEIVFTKYMDSWKTADQAVITVEPTTGKISSYRATMIEQMDANAKPNLDKARLDEVVTAKLDKIFEKAKEKYDQVSYGEYSYVLTKVSEKEYAIVCEVEVDCTEVEGEYKFITSERMSFVVT